MGALVGGTTAYCGIFTAKLLGAVIETSAVQPIVLFGIWAGAFIGAVGLNRALQAMNEAEDSED